ncbi:response regulator [bacterium]|nr:response regulator [bacterium]
MEKKTILIAEDDRNIAELIKKTLEPFGYTILMANNGEDACMSFVKNELDLIVLDILMPKMNGFQVCEWIRKRSNGQDIPIIMISGVYRKKEQQEEALRTLGASEFLIKPFRMDVLLEKIQIHLKKAESKDDEDDEDIILESELSKFSYVGSLAEKPIEALLHLLFVERETGKLVLRKGKLRINLFFKSGNLIFAQTNIKKLTLANYFYQAGKLTGQQYETSEREVRQHKKSREAAIRSLGYLTDEEIRFGMNLLFQDIVYLAFKWDEGDYYFIRHREPKSMGWQLLQSTANLIVGGIRRIDFLKRIDERIPSTEAVLQKSQNPLTRFQNVSLKTDEKDVLDLVDGSRSFGVIENTASLITRRARNILYALLVSGLIEVRTTATPVLDDFSADEDEEQFEQEVSYRIQNSGGNLLVEPFPEILFSCFRSSFTGEALLDNEGVEKSILFLKGRIISARSSLEDEKLGKVLFSIGRLDHKNFTKAMRVQSQKPNKKLGTILLDLGFLTEDQLRLALQLQIKKIVLEIFQWKKGNYLIQEKLIEDNQEISISINTANIILEGTRELKDPIIIKRFLPKEDLALKKIDDFELLTERFDFTEGERQIIKMLDGRKTLGELVKILGLGRLNVEAFFYALYAMKLVEVVARPKPTMVWADEDEKEAKTELHQDDQGDFVFETADEPVSRSGPRTGPAPESQSIEDLVFDHGYDSAFESQSPFAAQETQPLYSSSPESQIQPKEASAQDLRELEKTIDAKENMQNLIDEYYQLIQTGDYYSILKLERNATIRQIKVSYRNLAKQFHPDTVFNTGVGLSYDVVNEIFLKINEAYQTLSNPNSKEQYDREQPVRMPGETEEQLKFRADMAFQAGLKLLRNNQPLDSIDHFREAIRLFPKKGIYHTRLVEAYLDGQVPARRIIRSALEAVQLEPDLSEAHRVLGMVYYKLQDYGRARQEFEKAIELDQTNDKAKEWLDKIMKN